MNAQRLAQLLTEDFIPGTEKINNLENSRLPVDGDGMMTVVSLALSSLHGRGPQAGLPGSKESRWGQERGAYLLQTMEMATKDTTNTTPAAAEPAIRGSCSRSSDL